MQAKVPGDPSYRAPPKPTPNALATMQQAAVPTTNALANSPPSAAANALLTPPVQAGGSPAPYAALVQPRPVAPSGGPVGAAPAAGVMPGGAQSSSITAATPTTALPLDAVGAVAQRVRAAGLPPAQMASAAIAIEHGADLVADLLSRRTITADALKGAVGAAKAAAKYDGGAIDAFAGRLPPVSNQPALRDALGQHLAQSMTQLVALHSAAATQGVDLAGMLRASSASEPN